MKGFRGEQMHVRAVFIHSPLSLTKDFSPHRKPAVIAAPLLEAFFGQNSILFLTTSSNFSFQAFFFNLCKFMPSFVLCVVKPS